MKKEKSIDTYSYKGLMNSDYFLKRALGIYGYCFAGNIIILIFLLIIITVFSYFGSLIIN